VPDPRRAYRDGLAVVRVRYEAELATLRERVAALSASQRSQIPARLRRELDDLLVELAQEPRCVEEADAALARVAQLRLALDTADELRAMGLHVSRQRRRQLVIVAAIGAAALCAAAIIALDFRIELSQLQAQCAADPQCELTGACRANPRYILRHLPSNEACIASSDRDCAGPCRARGRCVARDGQCVAVDESACLASEACREEGFCRLDGHFCGQSTDADCRASTACLERAWCTSTPRGGCHLELDQDCAASKVCREEGRCVVLFGACVSASTKACRLQDRCETEQP